MVSQIQSEPDAFPEWAITYAFDNVGGKNKEYAEFVVRRLNELPQDKWYKSIISFTWTTRTAIAVVAGGYKGRLGGQLREAMLQAATELASNHDLKAIDAKQFESLVEGLSKINSDGLADDLYQRFAGFSPAPSKTFWGLFGVLLMSHAQNDERGARSPRRLLIPILRNKDVAGLATYLSFIKSPDYKLPSTDEATRNDIAELSKAGIETSDVDENYKNMLKELLVLWGMPYQKESNSPAGEEDPKDG